MVIVIKSGIVRAIQNRNGKEIFVLSQSYSEQFPITKKMNVLLSRRAPKIDQNSPRCAEHAESGEGSLTR